MASFYGNIKNNSRSSFIFDRIYSSRYEMEETLDNTLDENGAVKGDGVFINRYVLINYSYSASGAYMEAEDGEVTAANYTNYYRRSNDDTTYVAANYNENT